MFMKFLFRSAMLCSALLLFGATTVLAQGSCTSCTTQSSTLALSATIDTAVQLVISTGPSGATVSGSAGVFAVSLGTVNGFGVGAPASGVTVALSGSGATYTTPIFVTPSF